MIWAPDPTALPAARLYAGVTRAFTRFAVIDRLGQAQRESWQRRQRRRLFGAAIASRWNECEVLEREQLRTRIEQRSTTREAAVELSTSGSTGSPLRLTLPLGEYAAGLGAVAYGFLMSGMRPGDRIAHLCVPIGDGSRAHRLGPWQVRRVDLRLPGDEVAKVIDAFRPHAIYAYPSHLDVLLRDGHLRGSTPPRLVITNGEPLSGRLRSRLMSMWGCRVLESYGSVEFPRVAFACKAGTLHALDGAVMIETDPTTRDDDGFEDLLLTSLYHRRFPLARYRIGDRARVERHHQCECGRRGVTIVELQGRRDDLLRLPSGRCVSPRSVSLLEHDRRVREFQIVQLRLDRLALRVVATERLDQRDRAELMGLVQRGLGEEPVKIEFHQVAELPRTGSGKRRAVVSTLQ